MTTEFATYREILERVPHVRRAEIVEDGLGGFRVQVVSQSLQSPRHVVREIVSLLRMSGWHDIAPENVVVVQIQQEDEPRTNWGRLQIAGFAVTYGDSGYEANCRLSHGQKLYEGLAVAPSSLEAVARATVAAVNETLGQVSGLYLIEARHLSIAGVPLILAVVGDRDGDVMAGNAIHRDAPPEEVMIRAVLDAINRRFVVYTGQKV
ncbi:MAG: hypothetical protein C7B45_12890 [Sulfobacillus acidophilus]|uniref:Uncharacterized protein n=1 Tax=Sulfobacillus acidophilus TaxID=53633 RepID=A0A2T2WFB2_9FIRM|nr:MAG: hypothetical protein C7B45_12890 [Sulfobacillus acidophilus]